VPEASTRFALDDGETVVVTDGDLRELYELLWREAHKPGAISVAALIHAALLQPEFSRTPIALTTPQSRVLRETIAQLHAS
jgi:hypothetical protein